MTNEPVSPIYKEQEKMDQALARLSRNGNGSGGDGSGDDMKERVAALEAKVGGISDRLSSIDTRLDRMENKMLTSWDVAKVQAGIILFTLTIAMLGPKLLALLPPNSP